MFLILNRSIVLLLAFVIPLCVHGEGFRVLIVGSGGREHALAWKIAQSPLVDEIFLAPGNGGTASEKKVKNIDIGQQDIHALSAFAEALAIDLTIVGSEAPLALGIVDLFTSKGLRCFGPTQAAAQLETSKVFSKEFMTLYGIPTAAYASFSDFAEADRYLQTQSMPLVIKADGLAAGKGVVIANTIEEAREALQQMLVDQVFGSAGQQVVIEEFLQGEEVSYFVATDGTNFIPFSTAQDHKRRDDGDQGPNTGGMGAYSPVSLVTPEMERQIVDQIIAPTLNHMRARGIPYKGFLYAGLMISDKGPRVLEFNCRLGDPEAEVLLMRLQSDLVELCLAVTEEKLDQTTLAWDPRAALCVIMAAPHYPYPSPSQILPDLPEVQSPDQKIFHAGTRSVEGQLTSSSGRILCVGSLGTNLQEAFDQTYALVHSFAWPGVRFRSDIGYKELSKD